MSRQAERRIDVPKHRSMVGLGIADWDWDLQSGQFRCSDEWKRIRGLDGITNINEADERLSQVHPDDAGDLERHRAELIRGECEAYECDHRVRHSDGHWIWIAERCRAVCKNGKVVSLVGCDFEITERKQKELELRQRLEQHAPVANAVPAANGDAKKLLEQKQRLLAAIVEATPDLIGVSTPQREIIYHNKRAAELLPELSNPEDRPDFVNAHPPWAQKIVREQAVPTAIQNGSWSGETAIVGSDGEEIPVSQVLIAHKGSDGSVEAFSTIIRDISERKAAEEALRKSERKFASLAAAAPVSIFRFSDDSNCVYVNQRWAELTGRPVEEALGQKWMKCVHPDDLPHGPAAL